jgi:2'-5' RNA ligase
MTAVIVRTPLPAGLERLRRRAVPDAAWGVPAHVTLLYPFVDADGLDEAVHRMLADVAVNHPPIDFRLAAVATWPDTVYVVVEPPEPIVRLQADLQAAFPGHPLYGRRDPGFRFIPHVTIAEAGDGRRPEVRREDIDARGLPARRKARFLEVVTTDGEACRTIWRLPLAGRAGEASAR